MAGTVGGAPVQLSGSLTFDGLGQGGVVADMEPGGEQVIFTSGTVSFPEFWDGSAPGVVAMLRLPEGAQGPATWFCDADAPTVTFVPVGAPNTTGLLSITGTLGSLRALGACPGTPTTTHFALTNEGLTGAVDGMPFQSALNPGGLYPFGPLEIGAGFYEGGSLVLRESYPTAVVVLPASSADPGGVYCVGSAEDQSDGSTTFTQVTRLGSCAQAPAVAGSVSVCMVGH